PFVAVATCIIGTIVPVVVAIADSISSVIGSIVGGIICPIAPVGRSKTRGILGSIAIVCLLVLSRFFICWRTRANLIVLANFFGIFLHGLQARLFLELVLPCQRSCNERKFQHLILTFGLDGEVDVVVPEHPPFA